MNRRQLLGAVGGGASISVCGFLKTMSSNDEEVAYPKVSVHGDTTDPERNVALSVEVIQQFSRESPAEIQVAFTNTAESAREFYFGSTPPFSEYLSTERNDGTQLVAIPRNRSHISLGDVNDATGESSENQEIVPERPLDGCWRLHGDLAVWGFANQKTVKPGETLQEKFTVLDYSDNTTCLPGGEYRFVSPNYFGQNNPWGFTVELTYSE
ncbi:hypothetical protein [Halorussus sp. MSC15.2]|uniref:hypothetical protein n=1 Tax=Halorussus sp. MSC15.2 TaxID=2283638 RepID=UPI0013D357D8|nr:hypothetical protein [Halorussus sp. MSC15.2]NEU55493.1 hypothetical protein [Halorussus sp. MSC15.2]